MTHTPAPAEIETLRKIVAGRTCTEHDQRAAVAILDRLSPPEPEQPDEATVWTRKVLHAEYQITAYATGEMDDRAQFINARQVLSELIASKDAEADALAYDRDRWKERAEKVESKLAALRAENEPPDGYSGIRLACRDVLIDGGGLDFVQNRGWLCLDNVVLEISPKAAERKPAEPDDILSIRAERALGNIRSPKASAAETTPEVVVTQEGATSAQIYADYHCEDATWKVECAERLAAEFDRVRTEAEARGRREALECAQYIAEHVDDATTAKALQPIIDELKRLLTERK